MKQTKTARGRIIDMAAIAKANEELRAVSPGNVMLNARGDQIDKKGNVVATVQAKSKAVHESKTAPEKRKLSDAPSNGKSTKEKKPSAKATGDALRVIKQTEKQRDDGSRYLEVEFEDGSVAVTELD